MALLRNIATVGGWTMASRVLGFIRDVLIAQAIGTVACRAVLDVELFRARLRAGRRREKHKNQDAKTWNKRTRHGRHAPHA